MKRTFLLFFLLVAKVALAAGLPQLDPKLFNQLDTSKEICVNLDDDRLSKALIRAGTVTAGDLITSNLLDTAIIDIVESETATTAIAQDLSLGDDRLKQTMLKVLAAFNVSPVDAQGLVLGWADSNGAGNASLRAILFNALTRPEIMQRMRAYFMDNDIEWARTTKAFSSLLSGEDKELSNAIAIALSNATGNTITSTSGTIAKAQGGDFPAKWLLSSNLDKVMAANSSMARVLRAQSLAGDSIYEKVWFRVAEKIAADPMLVSEYAKRSYILTPLYDNLCTTLQRSVGEGMENSRAIGVALVNFSSIPGSRFEWMSNEILGPGGAMAFKKLKTQKEQNTALERTVGRLVALMESDQAWCDMIFWHMTRVGEAAVLTTRLALPETIAEDDRLATQMIRAGAPFGSEFEAKMVRAGAYSFYPGGSTEMRAKIQTGEVEMPALRQYMKTLAQLLSTDDAAWDSLFTDSYRGLNKYIAAIIEETLDRSTAASSAWIRTIQNNDQSLKAGFIKWLIENGLASNESTGALWIESVSSAVANGNLVGNTEVAKLKEALVRFAVSAEGWRLFNQRIAVESFGFPNPLRNLLVNRAVTTPTEFWPIYKKLTQTKGDTVSVLKANVINYVNASALPTLVLDETAAQNPFAADASSLIWDKMMETNGPLVAELVRLLKEGFTMNLSYGVASMAMIDILGQPEGWKLGNPYAAAFFGESPTEESLQRKTMAALGTNAGESTRLVSRLLEDSKIKEMWRQRCLALIKFLGKAPPLASTVRRDAAMSQQWCQEVAAKSASDAFLTQALVSALGMRRVGDTVFSGEVRNIRADLAKMVFYDRILFEQVLADKNRDYREALLGEVRKFFGTYIEQEWN